MFLTIGAVKICLWCQTSTWQDLRLPSNGTVTALEHSGNSLFVGMSSGRIFRSSDDGITWQMVNGVGSAPIRKFLFHDSVYLAASGTMLGRPYKFEGCPLGPTLCSDPASYGGLYRSIDSGKSWINRGPTGITALTSNGNNLFAAGREFYLSLNYGQNWNPLKISHGKVGSISIDEIPVNTLEMSWLGGKLYVSTKMGLFQGTLQGDSLHFVTSLEPALSMVTMPPFIFASTQGKVQRSTDGIHWDILTTQEFQFLYASGRKLFGITGGTRGALESDDSGKTWRAYSTPIRNATSFCVNGQSLFEGNEGYAVTVLRNRTGTWVAGGPGLYDFGVTGCILRKGAPIVSNWTGILQGSDAKAPIWTDAGGNGNVHVSGRLAYVDGEVYCLGNQYLWILRAGKPEIWDSLGNCINCQGWIVGSGFQIAFKSDNSILLCQVSDSCVTLPRNDFPLPQIKLPGHPEFGFSNMYRSGATHGDTLIVALDSLYRSTNRGHTWTKLGPLPGITIRLAYGSGAWHMLALKRGNLDNFTSLFTSQDGGQSWLQDHPEGIYPTVNAMCFRDGETYLGTTEGVYLFRNGANAWLKLGTGPSEFNVTSLAVEDNQLLAGLASGQVYGWQLAPVSIRNSGRGDVIKTRKKAEPWPSLVESRAGWHSLDGRKVKLHR